MKKTLILSIVLAVLLCGCTERRESVSELSPYNAAGNSDIAESSESFAESEESTVKLSREAKNFVGVWYNSEDLSEEWVFSEDGTVVIDGTKHNFSAGRNLRKELYIKIDEERCYIDSFYGDCDKLAFQFGNEKITLLAADSSELRETEKQKLYETECAELFARYPDTDGWTKQFDCGDIPLLADADYIERSAAEGFFLVSTPQELASYCWYVNTQDYIFSDMMKLTADIDLEGYDWAPMGWASDHPFAGSVDGAGHTISNMKISGFSDSGFIGWETYCYLVNISFENAYVQGGMAGIAAGQAIGGRYENVRVSGEVNGNKAGSMLGWDANCKKINCTADVLVNGEKFDFLSFNDKEKSEIVIENPVEITIDENHTVTRPEVEGYMNLGWMVFLDGDQMLHRNAENEYSYTYFGTTPGVYEIYLTAYVQGQYVPISNTVSYTIR